MCNFGQLNFFAEAVMVTATQAVETAQQLLHLSNDDRDKISGLGRAGIHIAGSPGADRATHRHLGFSGGEDRHHPGNVNKALGHLEQFGIVKELESNQEICQT